VLPLLALDILAVILPVSPCGIAYLLGILLTVSGLIAAPWTARYTIPTISGIVLVILVAGVRLSLVQNTGTSLQVVSLPQNQRTSWINTLVDEQDTLVVGETLFHWIGGDSKIEHQNLTPAFLNVYSQMRTEGNFSSPVLSTYLNLQRPEHFDAVVIGPDTKASFGMVFLHGYMGNVTAQCWVIAQAVKKIGGVTLCPSTVWTGEWWRPAGQQTIQATFDYLREQGIQTIYLAGFSNGGFSMGHLASQWGEQNLSGLIFMDGFVDGPDIRELNLPVLVIEGTQDERVPLQSARQFAAEVGDLATYVEIESDHFLIIKQPERVQNTIATWLEHQNNSQP
jgi:pimeloyl-ACP methyl ester carboxylesterase